MAQIKTFESFINDNDEKLFEGLDEAEFRNLSDSQRNNIKEMNKFIGKISMELFNNGDNEMVKRLMIVTGNTKLGAAWINQAVGSDETKCDVYGSENINADKLFDILCMGNNKFIVLNDCIYSQPDAVTNMLKSAAQGKKDAIISPRGNKNQGRNDLKDKLDGKDIPDHGNIGYGSIRFNGFIIILADSLESISDAFGESIDAIEARAKMIDLS